MIQGRLVSEMRDMPTIVITQLRKHQERLLPPPLYCNICVINKPK